MPADPPHRQAPFFPVWLRWILALTALAILPTAIMYAVSEGRFRWRLAKLRAAGFPTNLEELAARYDAITPEEDCANLWRQADRAVKSVKRPADDALLHNGIGIGERPNLTISWPELAHAKDILARSAPALEFIQQAVGRGGQTRRRVEDLDDLDELFLLIHSNKLCQLAFNVHWAENDIASAHRMLKTHFVITRAWTPPPRMIEGLFYFSGVSRSIDHAARLLTHEDVAPAMLEDLERDLEDIDLRTAFKKSLEGERAWFVSQMDKPEQDLLERWNMLLVRNDALDAMEAAIRLADLPWHKIVAESRRLEEQQKSEHELYDRFQLDYWTFHGIPESLVWAEAHRRLALVGIAVRRFTIANDRAPRSLDELTPTILAEVPLDPFTDQPFRYQPDKDCRLTLTSVGKDGEFDRPVSDDEPEPDDPVFRFRYPPVRGADGK